MNKYLLTLTLALIFPTLTFAAGTDISLDSNAILQVNNSTLNISGPTNTIEQAIVNNNGTLTITGNTGSSVTITSTSTLGTDTTTGVSSSCSNPIQTLTISGATTVIITPTLTNCTNPITPPTYTGGSSSSGSGGYYIPPIIRIATTTSTTTKYIFTKSLILTNENTEVTKLQQLLYKLGFLKVLPTGYYGKATEQAVKQYQISKKLEPVGFIGPSTRLALNSETILTTSSITSTVTSTTYIFTRDLTLGSEGLDVTKLQTILNAQNFLKVTPTGYFGNQTLQAVKLYQKSKSISDTGYVGSMTRRELGK